jgi:hypothetical protein
VVEVEGKVDKVVMGDTQLVESDLLVLTLLVVLVVLEGGG